MPHFHHKIFISVKCAIITRTTTTRHRINDGRTRSSLHIHTHTHQAKHTLFNLNIIKSHAHCLLLTLVRARARAFLCFGAKSSAEYIIYCTRFASASLQFIYFVACALFAPRVRSLGSLKRVGICGVVDR